jgi:hypothetical protein
MSQKIVTFTLLLFFVIPAFALAGTVQLPQTGQTTSYAAGDDGNLRMGVAWPNPRFTVSGDCVTDNLTGLMWTKNANMPGSGVTWQGALDYVATTVNSGAGTCGHSDWRLPNINELRSLVDYSRSRPALPGEHPFTNVQILYYWSSSNNTDAAATVIMLDGKVNYLLKYYSSNFYVWPVRAGN